MFSLHHSFVSLTKSERHDAGRGVAGVIIAPRIRAASVAAGVGVLILGHHPEQGGVGEGEGLNSALAAAGAAAAEWVGGAAGEVLRAELQQLVRHLSDLGVTRHCAGRSEGPATATRSLAIPIFTQHPLSCCT